MNDSKIESGKMYYPLIEPLVAFNYTANKIFWKKWIDQIMI